MAHRTGGGRAAGDVVRAVYEPAVSEQAVTGRLELRQLRYFVALAEEMHFGKAAFREHIAPSALTVHLQRLERALGVQLIDRGPRRTALTPAGARFLVEAREILAHVDRAALVARGAAHAPPALRVGVLDEGYDAVRPILRAVQVRHPDLEIHQVSAGVPEQCRLLADGRLDVGVGRAPGADRAVASELFRLDPLGVLMRAGHPLAARCGAIPMSLLRDETLLLGDPDRAPEFTEFVAEACRAAGFFPDLHHGSVQHLRAAVDLVLAGRCVLVLPASAATGSPQAAPGRSEVVWRPLEMPRYPWSLLWRAQEPSRHAIALVSAARRLCAERGWLAVPEEIAS